MTTQKYETMIRKIHNIKETVRRILINHPETRDDDHLLYLKVWAEQNPQLRTPSTTFYGFAQDFLAERYADTESIRRTRQKLQEQHPELRGKKYRARMAASFTMQNEMRRQLI